MNKLISSFFIVLFSVMAHGTASIGPDLLVKQTTDRVLNELKSNREVLLNDHEKLYRLVDEIVLPHFDFESMSRLVLGQHWRQASKEQRDKFVDEFKNLLVRTYATALFEYTGQNIVYKPLRLKNGDKTAVVKTEVELGDAPNVPLHYRLRQNTNGEWKVYDINIDGISLITNYRAAYGRTIQTEGLDALIASLNERNRALSRQ